MIGMIKFLPLEYEKKNYKREVKRKLIGKKIISKDKTIPIRIEISSHTFMDTKCTTDTKCFTRNNF